MTAFDPEKITFFAKTDARGQEVSFGIKAKDRQRHMYVVGKTGMGKSTLLENMAAQDIQNGEGMAFIDPHGSAAETLLEYVPEHRVKDVVYFAPFDLEHPISFNVMEDVGPDKRHLVVSGLMSTFKKIWVDAWSARMEYILTNALLALIEYPDTTLLSVNRLFTDKAYRKKVVEYIQDPAVKAFWVDEFANYTDRFTAEALPAIQNKIGQFTGNPLIRNIIGQPHSSFNIRELMDNQKILIMNLSKGLIGETNANLLGSMLTTRIYLAAMSRADLPVEQMQQMPNFYFYVDEFQSFANATFANILSEARKYHLNLIIAHQYIEQMEEDVRNAVFGNVGTTIAFRVGPFDAEVLETVFAPRFEATDLVNLGFAQVYLTLMIDGIGSQPFSAKTLPPVQRPAVSYREIVITSSRQLYAHDRTEVESLVAELHTPEPAPPPPKKSFDKKPGGGNSRSQGSAPSTSAARNGQGNGKFTESKAADRPKPSRPPEKTPEDLRNILAKMTTDQKPEEKPPANKPTDKKSEQPKPETKQANRDLARQPKQATELKPSSTRKPAAAQSATPSKPAGAKKGPELKRALADVLAKAKESAPPADSAPKPVVPKGETDGDAAAKPKTPPPAAVVSDQAAAVRKVVLKHREERATSAETAPPPSAAKAVVIAEEAPAESDSSVTAAEVKRLLRQNDSGRSPFN